MPIWKWQRLDVNDRYITNLAALSLVLTDRAAFSHVSAGVIHGLSLLAPDLSTLHVTRADLGASRREAGVHHHAAELSDDEVMVRGGWRVTSVARTCIDIARELDLSQGVAALDSALHHGVTPAQLTETLIACRTWPGARRAAHAIGLADGRAANAGESWSRVVLTGVGLPPTDIQRKLFDSDGLIGVADFVWDPPGVVGELDGRLKYRVASDAAAETAGDVVWAEKRREDRIRDLGYEVVRWVYADLYDAERLAARIRRALTRADGRRRTSA